MRSVGPVIYTIRGQELYTQKGFFIRRIFADRYIHRRELRLASLESWSSVEYELKNINFRSGQGVIEV